MRIAALLYFTNILYLKNKLEQLEIKSDKNIDQVIIDAIDINDVDASALDWHMLLAIINFTWISREPLTAWIINKRKPHTWLNHLPSIL
ncbi:hypothetical protein [Fodinibius sp.]|uniref:hypothetical protein n=1 Tax=Fodinibius sp. TaxID=1872440 RepID=UPI003A100120